MPAWIQEMGKQTSSLIKDFCHFKYDIVLSPAIIISTSSTCKIHSLFPRCPKVLSYFNINFVLNILLSKLGPGVNNMPCVKFLLIQRSVN